MLFTIISVFKAVLELLFGSDETRTDSTPARNIHISPGWPVCLINVTFHINYIGVSFTHRRISPGYYCILTKTTKSIHSSSEKVKIFVLVIRNEQHSKCMYYTIPHKGSSKVKYFYEFQISLIFFNRTFFTFIKIFSYSLHEPVY